MRLEYDFALMCPDVIAHNARVYRDTVAVVCEDERLTWREFDEQTNKFANVLRSHGLGKGDKVALFMSASLEAFLAFWGSAKAGCVTVPLNVMLDGEVLVRLTADSDAVAMVADAATEPVLNKVRGQLGSIPEANWLTFGSGGQGWNTLTKPMTEADVTACGTKIDPNDIITILYTSGTTGTPKGIEHTHVSRMMYPYGFAMGLKIDRHSVAVLGTPPYASGTWITMMPTMYRGGTVVILKKFSAEAFLSAVERERGTHSFLVPTQWIAILEHPNARNYDASSLRCIVTSGQPIAETTYNAIDELFPNAGIHEVYGFSEGFATLRLPEDADRGKRASVGKPIMLEDIRIVDEDGNEVGPGETGEIVAHAIGMMTGYYKNPELTRQATWIAPDGRSFMRTGDLGYLDEDGFMYVAGRLKDMIKSGGINVFAADIERVFMDDPEVSEAAAVAVPDEKWGETPVVVIIPAPGATPDAEQLRLRANEHLAKYQRVRKVLIRDELPRVVYGKVDKSVLKDELGTGGLL